MNRRRTRRWRPSCAETHEAWLEDAHYLKMDLLVEQHKEALCLAA